MMRLIMTAALAAFASAQCDLTPGTDCSSDTCTYTAPVTGSDAISASDAVSEGCPNTVADCTFTPDDAATCGTGCTYTAPEDAVVESCTAPDPVVTESDTTACTLASSEDFGVTPGTCADADSGVATCAYVAGAYSGDPLDTIDTADSCTSTTVVPACTLTAGTDCSTGTTCTYEAAAPAGANTCSDPDCTYTAASDAVTAQDAVTAVDEACAVTAVAAATCATFTCTA